MIRVKRPVSRLATAILGLSMVVSLLGPATLSASAQGRTPNDLNTNIAASPANMPVLADSGFVKGELLVKLSDASAVKPGGSGFAASSLTLAQALNCFQLKVSEQVAPDTYELTGNA